MIQDVMYRGRSTGEICGNTYVTVRSHGKKGFMRKFLGFGVSVDILNMLKEKKVEFVLIEYRGARGVEMWHGRVSDFLASKKEHVDDGDDLQRFLSKSELYRVPRDLGVDK